MDAAPHPGPLARRTIDVAVGILVALRRCPEEHAFGEIAATVRRTGLPLSDVAKALITLARADQTHEAHRHATNIWGDLFDARVA